MVWKFMALKFDDKRCGGVKEDDGVADCELGEEKEEKKGQGYPLAEGRPFRFARYRVVEMSLGKQCRSG